VHGRVRNDPLHGDTRLAGLAKGARGNAPGQVRQGTRGGPVGTRAGASAELGSGSQMGSQNGSG
jgi:hypothetical protein